MRVLVVHGSKLGGTEGIAARIAEHLMTRGIEAVSKPAADLPSPDGFDAVVVGGALYADHWFKTARKYVKRYSELLATRPVWMFSSGPLDDTGLDNLPPTRQVEELIQLVGARDHITFGGRLAEDAKGFLAGSMAKTMAGDWRDEHQIVAWADSIATVLLKHEAA